MALPRLDASIPVHFLAASGGRFSALLLAMTGLTSAGCADDACRSDRNCGGSQVCVQGQCVASLGDAESSAEATAEDGAAETTANADVADESQTDGGNAPGDPAACPFPHAEGTATFLEGLDTAVPSVGATFSGGGALLTVDGLACEPSNTAPMPERFNPESHACAEAYWCGECWVWILDNAASGFIFAGDSEDACPEYAGFFTFGVFGDAAADGDGDAEDGGDGSAACAPQCGLNEFCDDGVCSCSAGCRQGTVCCGGILCAGDCVGTPCC